MLGCLFGQTVYFTEEIFSFFNYKFYSIFFQGESGCRPIDILGHHILTSLTMGRARVRAWTLGKSLHCSEKQGVC